MFVCKYALSFWLYISTVRRIQGRGARRKAPQWELPRHGPSLWLRQRAGGNNKGRGREQSQRRRRRRQSRRLPRAPNRTRATEKQLIPKSLNCAIKALWVSNTNGKCFCVQAGHASLQGDRVAAELGREMASRIFFSFLPYFFEKPSYAHQEPG